jgi:FAD dependent monooxygenase
VSIESRESHAIVRTADNHEYKGHLVVGADGVHSIVRSEMWRHANELAPETISDKEKTSKKLST